MKPDLLLEILIVNCHASRRVRIKRKRTGCFTLGKYFLAANATTTFTIRHLMIYDASRTRTWYLTINKLLQGTRKFTIGSIWPARNFLGKSSAEAYSLQVFSTGLGSWYMKLESPVVAFFVTNRYKQI